MILGALTAANGGVDVLGVIVSPTLINETSTSTTGTSIDFFRIEPYGGVPPYSIAVSSDNASVDPNPLTFTGVTTYADCYIDYALLSYEQTATITIEVTDAALITTTYITSATFTRSDVSPP